MSHLLLAFCYTGSGRQGWRHVGLSPENAVSRGKDVATLSSSHLLRQTLKAKTGRQSPFPWELFSHRTRRKGVALGPHLLVHLPFSPALREPPSCHMNQNIKVH